MALDGIFLKSIIYELEEFIINSRVEKIYQTSKEELIISIRFKGGSKKLLINACATSARIHFTDVAVESPKSPPMFCMLLRKHLNSSKIISIEQKGLDRIIYINFESVDETGELKNLKLAVEIMGRHSNIILINQDNIVIDSIKRITPDISQVRPIIPHSAYTCPPSQSKKNILETPEEEILTELACKPKSDIWKNILNTIEGISPIVAREIDYYISKGSPVNNQEFSDEIKIRFLFYLKNLKTKILSKSFEFTILSEKGVPKDFSFINIEQYDSLILNRRFQKPSDLLDKFYSEDDSLSRTKQRAGSLFKFILNTSEKIEKRINIQKQKLIECKEKEKFKINGELIIANIYKIKKGDEKTKVENYYEDPAEIVEIELSPLLSPQENANKYFIEYKKLVTAEKIAKAIIKKSEIERKYIDTIFDSLTRTKSEEDILEIKQELAEQGYIKPINLKHKNKSIKLKPPLKYTSSDGYIILCGRNNKQNDLLTLKQSKKQDIWFHTQNIPGSHVILLVDDLDQEIPSNTLKEAANIAAVNSKAYASSKVPVDYTSIKNVKKPKGSKPGMVIFDKNKTIYITPDKEFTDTLKK